MANYYTKISFAVCMDEDQFEWLKALHEANMARANSEEEDNQPDPAALPADMRPAYEALDEFEGWNICDIEFSEDDFGKPCACFESDEADCDYLAALIQAFLQRFEINDAVVFQWSNDCSRPVVDAYGGGAFVVTKSAIHGMSTSDWVHETLERLAKNAANV